MASSNTSFITLLYNFLKLIIFYMFFTEQLLSLSHLYLFSLLSGLAQHITLLPCNLKLVVIISHSFHGQRYFYIEKDFLELNICN